MFSRSSNLDIIYRVEICIVLQYYLKNHPCFFVLLLIWVTGYRVFLSLLLPDEYDGFIVSRSQVLAVWRPSDHINCFLVSRQICSDFQVYWSSFWPGNVPNLQRRHVLKFYRSCYYYFIHLWSLNSHQNMRIRSTSC